MTITSVINIDIKVDLPSVNKNVDLPSVIKTKNFWQKFKNIIKYNISHTPSEVGVLVNIIFSHTPEIAMSGGLVKACVPSKNQFCSREMEFLNLVFCIFRCFSVDLFFTIWQVCAVWAALTKFFYFIDPCLIVVSTVICSIVCISIVWYISIVITIVFCIPVMIFMFMSICIVVMTFVVRRGVMWVFFCHG